MVRSSAVISGRSQEVFLIKITHIRQLTAANKYYVVYCVLNGKMAWKLLAMRDPHIAEWKLEKIMQSKK